MQPRPKVVVFDVNETLSDMAPMAERFADVGAQTLLAKVWFATLLRDGFALTAAGGQEPFARLGEGALRTALAGVPLNQPIDGAVERILSGFADLDVHPDVPDGVAALHAAGLRLVTLTNGSTEVAERLLGKAGILASFDRLLSVEDAGAWKPARAPYDYAARVCAVPLEQMLLVAVHPWDIDGAHRAGMRTGWIDRQGAPFPEYFSVPDLEAPSLVALAEKILA